MARCSWELSCAGTLVCEEIGEHSIKSTQGLICSCQSITTCPFFSLSSFVILIVVVSKGNFHDDASGLCDTDINVREKVQLFMHT